MEKIYYTYAFLREDGTPYYIGKGKGKRAFKWRKTAPSDKSRILILKKDLTEEEAFKHEIYMIAIFGKKMFGKGILWNITDGGEGCSMPSPRKGKPLEPEHAKQVRAIGKRCGKEVVVKNKQTGEVRSFPSQSAGARALGVSQQDLSCLMSGKGRNGRRCLSVKGWVKAS